MITGAASDPTASRPPATLRYPHPMQQRCPHERPPALPRQAVRMRPTLTPDQRHLLAFVGRSSGSALLDAFLEERALRSLLARAGGASGPTAPHGAPDWMTSYWTVGSKFISPRPGSGLSLIHI